MFTARRPAQLRLPAGGKPAPFIQGSNRPRSRQLQFTPAHSFKPDSSLDLSVHYTQEVLTFITADGVTYVPGNFVPRPRVPKIADNGFQRFPSWEEQKLCVGGSFRVAASNGSNPARRINFVGFCQSTDVLSEIVEEAVLGTGGEVMHHEKKLKSGLHETVEMTVAMPLLWGVPPRVDLLSHAIRQGGGILDRVYQQWYLY